MLIHSLISTLVLAVSTFGGVPSDDHEADKASIQQLWQELDRCNNEKDGEKVVALFSKESFKHNEKLMKLAMDGTREQVKALGGTERAEVFHIRLMAKRSDIEKLNGKGYARWSTSQGWYVTPADERTEDTLDDFKFNSAGTEATARLKSDGEDRKVRLRFVMEDGKWKFDEPHAYAEFDKELKAAAKEQKKTEDDLIKEFVEKETGKKMTDVVWSPMRR